MELTAKSTAIAQPSQEMPKALRNSTFTSFLSKHGLELWSVEYLSAEYRPGNACLCLIISMMPTARPIRIACSQSLGALSGHSTGSTQRGQRRIACRAHLGRLLAGVVDFN